MNYLYGDSTPSQLTSNFLEFLRDALDFCVFVLQADVRIKKGKAEIRELNEKADVESARLDRFIKSVSLAVEQGDKGLPESPTARCGQRMYSLIADSYRTSLEGIRQTLSEAIARIDADDAASREGCVSALGALMAPHDPPGATDLTQVALGESGRYHATVTGKSEPGLDWTLGASIPDGHLFVAPLRIERLVPHLEIRAPQLAGWITKEVKTKPQRLERHLVMKVVDDRTTLSFELRLETNPEQGFDFEVNIQGKTVTAKRVGAADDQSIGAFEVQNEDVMSLVDLAEKLRAGVAGIERKPNIVATVDGADFRSLPAFIEFVERMVAFMSPIVREISQRSLTPRELVLRRKLGDDRREEIFVAKSTLQEKLVGLPPELRWLFAPLGLDISMGSRAEQPKPSASSPPAETPKEGKPPIRSELPPSTGSVPPPPPLPPPAPPPKNLGVAPAPIAPPRVPKSAPPASGMPRVQTLPAAPAPAPPSASRPSSDSPDIEVGEEEEIDLVPDDGVPDSERDLAAPPPPGEKRNEALVIALKKIMTLSKNGRANEAYQEYATLFASPTFAGYRIEDQRQALKLLILAKTHPAATDAVTSAHRAALSRLQALVADGREPADQEMLGVAHLVLGDERAAQIAFQTGLDAERVRNPQSDLIASLMRRVSSL